MLSLSNVKMVQAANYYERDDYYTRSVENTDDTWQGKLSDRYSQNGGQLTAEDFTTALKSMPNPERAAIDLTFSAPKSVSIAMVLDETKKADMLAAHNQAVSDTLIEIEKNEIEARITKNGLTERVKTGNMAVAKFNHFVSRNQDMQLHTHAVVLNRTAFNGKSYAISNENLYQNHILYGQLYRNRLAANLHDMGYSCQVIDAEKGFFELEGIDDKTIKHFSSRRAEILEKLKEWNTDSSIAADRATLLTRKAKVHKDLGVLEESWREQLKDENISLSKGEKICIDKSTQTEAFERAVVRLSEKQFAFSVKELERAALAEGCTTGMDRAAFNKILQKSDLVELGKLDNQDYYTTNQNISIEDEIKKNFIKSKAKINPIEKAQIKLEELSRLEGLTLGSEQQEAILHITRSTKQYVAIQGLAGTGKTYMLKAARQLFEQNGYEVSGMSFTGKAAESLQNEAKINSTTLHSFLHKLEKEAGNLSEVKGDIKNTWNFSGLKASVKPQLWVVDEAGMTDNNLLLHLQRAAKLKNAKVVLVGDYQQLQPVGIGNAYAKFVQSGDLPTCYMSDIRRQENAELLQAVKEAVSGDVNKSLAILKEDTVEIKSLQKRFKAIADEYGELSAAEQDQTIVLTAKNKDRTAINDQIRTKFIKAGRIDERKGQTVKTVNNQSIEIERNFAPNDKIIFLKNDYKLGVKNGQTGKISAIDEHAMTVESNGKSIRINFAESEYKNLDYGYCVTTHKAQGMTVNKAIINVDSTQKALNTRNGYYVNISRAKNSVKIFTDDREKIGQQVNSWMKKVTSEDFLIASSGSKIGAKIKGKIVSIKKLPLKIPGIPIIGTIMTMPIKVLAVGLKIGIKAADAAMKMSEETLKVDPKKMKKAKGLHR